jgi:hypothetical protein
VESCKLRFIAKAKQDNPIADQSFPSDLGFIAKHYSRPTVNCCWHSLLGLVLVGSLWDIEKFIDKCLSKVMQDQVGRYLESMESRHDIILPRSIFR